MKRILIVTTHLDLGGITSFVINLSNFLADEGHEVSLMYTSDNRNMLTNVDNKVNLVKFSTPPTKKLVNRIIRKGYVFYLLNLIFRNKKKVSPMKSLQRINYVKAIYTDKNENLYDVAISSAEFFCNTYVAYNTKALLKIGWIHPDYASLKVDIDFDRRTLDCLDKIVTISESCKKSLLKLIPEYEKKTEMIENILDHENIKRKANELISDFDFSFTGLKILTVSRLDNSSKRLDRAINACKKLVENGIDVKWYLIGDGKDKIMLKEQILNLGIEEHFVLLGARTNPYPYIKNADLFILTSQYEGKPIVVSEALILECPVIVTNYLSARDQINESYGTVLSNDDDLFVKELIHIIKDKNLLRTWKYNMKNYDFSNDETYFKIRKLLGDQSYD